MKVFTGATVLANGTFTSGVNIHTGQFFFNVSRPLGRNWTNDRTRLLKV